MLTAQSAQVLSAFKYLVAGQLVAVTQALLIRIWPAGQTHAEKSALEVKPAAQSLQNDKPDAST